MPDRIVTSLPLRELWDEHGPMAAARVRDLSKEETRDLLRIGQVRFVVVDVGKKPEWVEGDACHSFWKVEVLPHLVDPGSRVVLESMPGEYGYFASEWRAVGSVILVLEKCH